MADEPNKPTAPASPTEGAGTKTHKLSKADQAKLPGGADFDAENASAEDFDKHTEILRRRSVLAGLAAPVEQVALVEAPAPALEPAPNPGDIYAKKDGEGRYFTPTTWALMGDNRYGWVQTVAKPADIS